MVVVQKQALDLLEEKSIRAVRIPGLGWVFPTDIRDDYKQHGQEKAEQMARYIVQKLQ